MIPLVAIVGRPNVGKSTLLNTLAGVRIAIVEEIAGVTRDRVSTRIEYRDREFELMDTGGIGMVDVADIAGHVEEQVDLALGEADLIVFLTDIRDGVTSLDRVVADQLRRLDQPVILVANKAETRELEMGAYEFHQLGLGEPLLISAQNRIATTEVLDRIVKTLPEPEEGTADSGEGVKIALVGRMNAGKSTFLNQVLGRDRVIVSEHPGTTRDSVDVRVTVDERNFTLIDTAGVRRKKTISGTLDYLSQHRTERSIRRADVVLLLLDVTKEVGELDKKIANYSLAHFKPTILVVNKWDLVEGKTPEEFTEYFHEKIPGLHYSPMIFASAMEGTSVPQCLELAEELVGQARVRVGTGELNRIFREAMEVRSPRVKKSKVPKLFYVSQVSTEPPTIVAFVNDPGLFRPGYRRYLENRLRGILPFAEIPLRLVFRARRPGTKKPESAE
jgi:GTP-binding protein